MGLRDSGLKAAGGIAKKVRGSVPGAGGTAGDRKGQHSIEFHKSKGQHILKNPLARYADAHARRARARGAASRRRGLLALAPPATCARCSRRLPSARRR